MRTLVAVPVYNEEQYIHKVIAKIARFASDDVLVIDDGSTDATPSLLAQQPVDVIRHKTNRGYGRSIRDAFRWADCYGYHWLITMDCDEQHEPESLPDFQQAIERDDADVISGSRYLDQALCGDPPPTDRRQINGQITQTLNQQLGLSLTDSFCGYKAYRTRCLKDLDLNVAGYAMPIQAWVQHAAHCHRIREIPVRLIYQDPNRSFGGPLDDPTKRLAYYQSVLDTELAKHPEALVQDQAEMASAEEKCVCAS